MLCGWNFYCLTVECLGVFDRQTNLNEHEIRHFYVYFYFGFKLDKKQKQNHSHL